jgi:hypothetical protein
VWLGEGEVVIGLGSPLVLNYLGDHIAEIPLGGAMIASLAASVPERRLLITDLNRTLAWVATETWTILDRWPGPWFYAAISPDARFAVALEPWGKLHFASLETDRFEPLGIETAHPGAISLAVSSNAIATVGGGEVRWARLHVNCEARPSL